MRILLVDDHPLLQRGFAAMLAAERPAVRCVAATSCAEACAALLKDNAYDLALVDLQLPDADGFETLRRLAGIAPLVPRAILSGREDRAARDRARQAGASGYIAKSAEPRLIMEQVDRLIAGDCVWDDVAGPAPTLTPRQREVLDLLCDGCANKEIRYRLGIADRTVRLHMTELFHLLGAQSRVQAILRARAMGLAP